VTVPNEVLGRAVRELGTVPSKDWMEGFDAGFDAGAALMSEFKELADDLVKRLLEIADASQGVGQLCHFADAEIRRRVYRKWKY